ncbi:adenylate kinase [Streptacidiphilus sp. EB103A]|uniref:adenylate kinase n=1 Tax=Streptacidiphilus sp. EB103A TaxID=3156275 RepID=UPI003512F587
MRLVLLGPPGAGKGTQSVLLAASLDVPHISTGDLFRGHVERGTALGEQVRAIMTTGGLVPTALTVAVVEERLSHGDAADGFLLDGFPRSTVQAEALDRILASRAQELSAAVLLDLPDDEVVRRIAGRRVCGRDPSHTFHQDTAPPLRAGECDYCGGALHRRTDDEPATVLRRQELYRSETAPLVDYYLRAGLLRRVDALGPVAEVGNRVQRALAASRR